MATHGGNDRRWAGLRAPARHVGPPIGGDWARHPVGRAVAPLLAPRGPLHRGHRRAPPGPPAGLGPDPVPVHRRHPRAPHAPLLPPLYLGRVEENGIRCPYHGWLFAADGTCLDQPCEPERGVAYGSATGSASRGTRWWITTACFRLPRPGRPPAGVPPLRHLRGPERRRGDRGHRPLRLWRPRRGPVQLVPDARELGGRLPRVHPPRATTRPRWARIPASDPARHRIELGGTDPGVNYAAHRRPPPRDCSLSQTVDPDAVATPRQRLEQDLTLTSPDTNPQDLRLLH